MKSRRCSASFTLIRLLTWTPDWQPKTSWTVSYNKTTGRSSVSEGTSYWGSKRSWIAVLGSPVNTSTSTHLGPDDSELESLHVSQSDALNKLISFTWSENCQLQRCLLILWILKPFTFFYFPLKCIKCFLWYSASHKGMDVYGFSPYFSFVKESIFLTVFRGQLYQVLLSMFSKIPSATLHIVFILPAKSQLSNPHDFILLLLLEVISL